MIPNLNSCAQSLLPGIYNDIIVSFEGECYLLSTRKAATTAGERDMPAWQ